MVMLGSPRKGAQEMIALLNEPVVLFCDTDDTIGDTYKGARVLRTLQELRQYFEDVDERYIIGAGYPHTRKVLADKANDAGGKPYTLQSTTATAHNAEVGKGVYIADGVEISTNVTISNYVYINRAAVVCHDCTIGKYSVLSPSSVLLGGVTLGDYVEVGGNATILPNIKIGAHAIVGAGAVVTKDVPDYTTVVGIPAKPLEA